MTTRNPIQSFFRSVFAWLTGSPYDGANTSTKRSYPPNAQIQDARFDATEATRLEIVKKSRDFERNNPMFNRLCDLFEQYTVGTGLQISPASSDTEWNARARKSFETWSRYADLTSRQPLGTLQGLWARTWFVDGEVFIVLTHGEPDRDGRRRPRVKTYEGHRCETPSSMEAQEGKSIIDGVEIDPRGRPIAYWFRKDNGEYWENKLASYERIDAEFCIHIFEPSRFGQYRGLPFCYPSINDFTDLQDIDRLEMEAAKEAARRTDVIQTEGGDLTTEAARRARFGALATYPVPTAGTADLGQAAERVTGTKPLVLPVNAKFQQYVSQRPSVVTQQYYIAREEKACAGIGIPRVLVFPAQMQGTQYRGAMDAANSFFISRFSVIAAAMRRVYEFWGAWAKQNEPELFNAPVDWFNVSICAPRAVNVDVGYNSAAMLAELQAGATNYERVYGPLGLDWREEFKKLKEQQDFARSIGLQLPGVTPLSAPTEPTGGTPNE